MADAGGHASAPGPRILLAPAYRPPCLSPPPMTTESRWGDVARQTIKIHAALHTRLKETNASHVSMDVWLRGKHDVGCPHQEQGRQSMTIALNDRQRNIHHSSHPVRVQHSTASCTTPPPRSGWSRFSLGEEALVHSGTRSCRTLLMHVVQLCHPSLQPSHAIPFGRSQSNLLRFTYLPPSPLSPCRHIGVMRRNVFRKVRWTPGNQQAPSLP